MSKLISFLYRRIYR